MARLLESLSRPLLLSEDAGQRQPVRQCYYTARKVTHDFVHPDDTHADIYGTAFYRASRGFQCLVVALVAFNLMLMFAARDVELTSAMQSLTAFTVVVFTLEYTARLWTCIEVSDSVRHPCMARLDFASRPLNVLDLATVVAMWLYVLECGTMQASGASALRLGRLARIARLARVARSVSHLSAWSANENEQKLRKHILLLEQRASAPPDLEQRHPMSDQQLEALEALQTAIDSRSIASFEESMQLCTTLAVPEQDINSMKLQKRLESEEAGVSLAFLLSPEFESMARQATGKEDPSFIEMQEPFFLHGTEPIGKGLLCPRDLRPGCAFIDTLPPKHRKRTNCFLSWVWGYRLSVVRSGLARWAESNVEDPEGTFLYMCFFCNNQWRILVEQSAEGSDNLQEVFEGRLKKAGRMVALMDSWHNPLYITRIWTIFEQYETIRLGIKVQFTLPEEPAASLLEQLGKGKEVIMLVVREVSKVNAENAQATRKQDEVNVKALIANTIGFSEVNTRVKRTITQWVASEFKDLIDELVAEAEEQEESSPTFQAHAVIAHRSARIRTDSHFRRSLTLSSNTGDHL